MGFGSGLGERMEESGRGPASIESLDELESADSPRIPAWLALRSRSYCSYLEVRLPPVNPIDWRAATNAALLSVDPDPLTALGIVRKKTMTDRLAPTVTSMRK